MEPLFWVMKEKRKHMIVYGEKIAYGNQSHKKTSKRIYDTVTREAFKVKVEFLNYCQIENIYFYFYQGIYSKNTTKQDNLRDSQSSKRNLRTLNSS